MVQAEQVATAAVGAVGAAAVATAVAKVATAVVWEETVVGEVTAEAVGCTNRASSLHHQAHHCLEPSHQQTNPYSRQRRLRPKVQYRQSIPFQQL